ncbi:MAG: hypothetical protein EA398_06145 [Deltaproteobacteria bacterium]|nr:MAG: hypothetical protein EA398_06145 [Deltaproteobacteria bacterium]
MSTRSSNMNRSRPFAIAAIAVCLMLPGTAVLAQGYNNEGMPYRDCDADWEPPEDLGSGPVRGADLTAAGLTRAEAEALRRQEEDLQQDLIRQYLELLDTMSPQSARRADITFRLAEATRELARVIYQAERVVFNECMDNWFACTSDEVCYEPRPDLATPIRYYREIARNHPDYNRLDEVFFRLGESQIDNDQAADGVQTLTRLVNNYPQSIYLAEAYKLMGDHFFDQDLLIAARQNYDNVMQFPNSDVYLDAIYMLGWVDINEGDFEGALAQFQRVVGTIDQRNVRPDLRRQSLNDMLLAYAEVDSGWQRARAYYEEGEGEEFMRQQLTRLSGRLDEQGKDEERVELLAYFINRYPMDDRRVTWSEQSLDSYEKIGDWERYEAAARRFVADLHGSGEWFQAHAANERTATRASAFTERTFLFLINRNYIEAERLTTMPQRQFELYNQVAADFAEFFRLFPESEEFYDQSFQYAELLYYKLANGGQFSDELLISREQFDQYLRRAGDQYRRVVEMRPDPDAEHTHDAAIGAFQVYDDFMVREVPDIDAPIPPPHEFTFGERQELGPASQDYVEIVAWFANIFPEDEIIPAASWRAASLFLRANQVAEAAERFETIIAHHANHRLAQTAALAAFVCYNHVENWERIESVARMILQNCADLGRSDEDCERDRFEQAIAYAMNNQAEDLMTAGERLELEDLTNEAQEQYLAAAELRIRLFEEFPDSEWSPNALFSAAATFEQARRVDTAIGHFEEYIRRYSDHENVPDARYVLGLIYDSQAEFDTAAGWFESLDDYPDFGERNDAVFRAARLREALSDFDRANELYVRVKELEGDSDDTRQIYFIRADMERDRGNLDESFARLQEFRTRFGSVEPVLSMVALARQADIRERQGRSADALGLHREFYNAFGPGVPAIDDSDRFTGWATPPGGNFEDDDRVRLVPFAARARFAMAQAGYEAAQSSSLAFRPGRWQELRDNMVRRGELMQASQNEFFEVTNIGDASWAVASALRIGQLYHQFYRDIFALDPPDFDDCLDRGFSYDQCDQLEDQYNDALYEIGDPLLGNAMEALGQGFMLAQREGIFTEWTQELVAEMNSIDRTVRVGGEEGVVANATSDPFIATNYILDLTEKERAFRDFVETPLFEVLPGTNDGSSPSAPTGGEGTERDDDDSYDSLSRAD